jgi:general secretion pathway protein E
VVSRIKVMAKLDIAEKRLPQDGRISLRIAGRAGRRARLDDPVGHGERVVLRLLDKQAGRLDLGQLGMDDAEDPPDGRADPQAARHPAGHRPHRLGQDHHAVRGAGALNDNTRNIMTVEDPIEYYIDGIGQTQVNTKVDMTFARGLRAILRQDPDVVMVGEIRDLETAQIAVQASLTGHLVLSTLHTNTAVGAVTRLRDMGIEPFLLSSSLIGVLAQRLVRVLNPDTKQAFQAGDYERRLLNLEAAGRPRRPSTARGATQWLSRPHRHLRADADRRRDAHHDPRRRRRAGSRAPRPHDDAVDPRRRPRRCCAARRPSRKSCA